MTNLQASLPAIFTFVIGFFVIWAGALFLFPRATARFALDWLEATFVSFMSSAVLAGWVGTLLAALGVFALGLLGWLLLAAGAALIVGLRPRALPRFTRLSWVDGLLLVVVAAGAVIYFQPHEYILGGTDAGTYVNIAATLAENGDYVFEDEWYAFLREHAETTLRSQPAQWETDYLQFVGWYLDNEEPARVIPQFFSFHPVWLAIGVSLAGLEGAYLLSPLWMVMGLIAVYLLARALFGARTGFLAVIILGMNALIIFFGRYPTTEPLTLLLLFSGLLAFQRLWEEPDSPPVWGLFGGLTLGAALLTRIDLPLVIVLLAVAGLWQWRRRRWSRAWTALALTFGLLAAQAVLFAVWLHWPYTWNTYGSVLRTLREELVLLGGAALIAVLFGGALAWKVRHDPRDHRSWARIWQQNWWRWAVAVALVLLSGYAYFVRPLQETGVAYSSWPGGQPIPRLDDENWVRLGWYVTPLGLLLATLGAAYLLVRESWRRLWFFLALSLLTTVQYVYNVFNTPYQIYAMRRYVPVVVPALAIFSAVLLTRLFLRAGARLRLATGAAITVALLGWLVFQARYVLPQQDFDEAPAQLVELAAQLEPGAIVIIDEPAAGNFADRFGAPLYFLFDHPVATIRRGDAEQVAAFLGDLQAYAAANERPLQLLTVDPLDDSIRTALPLQPESMVPFRTTMLANTFDSFPSTVQTIYYGLELYTVGQTEPAVVTTQVTVDVGTLDALYLVDGFYYKEPRPGEITMRWTGERAELRIPMDRSGTVTAALRAMIYRPDMVAATTVRVLLDGEEIGEFTPEEVWQTYTFAGETRPVAGESRLALVSTPFTPADYQISADRRALGFLVDWVRVEAGDLELP